MTSNVSPTQHQPRKLLLCAFLCFLFAGFGFAQVNRDYDKGPLKWDEDFKQPAPPDSEFDAAVTCDIRLEKPTKEAISSGKKRGVPPNGCILCEKECDPKEDGKRSFKLKKSKKCRVKVKAFIRRNMSWSKKDKQSDELLSHEQGHFDLWEATARAAEKKINDEVHCITAINCKLAGKNAFRAHINALIREARAKGVAINKKYDEETNHGRKKEKQKEWKKKIKKLLSIKGGPSWDQMNGLVSTEEQGGEGKKPHKDNYPVTPLTFSEVTINSNPWSDGPIVLVLPPMIFENHENSQSRIWAYDSQATIAIHDESFNLVGTASFSAFFGNENDTEFRAILSGPVQAASIEDQEPLPLDPEAPSVFEDETDYVDGQLIIRFNHSLGETLAGMGPFETFGVTYEMVSAPAYPAAGDVNYDGTVNAEDIEALVNALAGEEILILPETGDVNGDGQVTEADVEALTALVNGDTQVVGIE